MGYGKDTPLTPVLCVTSISRYFLSGFRINKFKLSREQGRGGGGVLVTGRLNGFQVNGEINCR